jgi:hypothetical protein
MKIILNLFISLNMAFSSNIVWSAEKESDSKATKPHGVLLQNSIAGQLWRSWTGGGESSVKEAAKEAVQKPQKEFSQQDIFLQKVQNIPKKYNLEINPEPMAAEKTYKEGEHVGFAEGRNKVNYIEGKVEGETYRIEIEPTPKAALRGFMPSTYFSEKGKLNEFAFSMTLGAAKKRFSENRILPHTARVFPYEAMKFYTAIGVLAVTKLSMDYWKNPQALNQFIESMKDPVGHLSFFMFMLANRQAGELLGGVMRGSLSKHFVGYLGMTTGLLASEIFTDLWHAKNLQKCAFGFLKKQNKLERSKQLTACDTAFDDMVMTENKSKYLSSVGSLLGAAMLNGLVRKGVVSSYKKNKRFIFKHTGLMVKTNLPPKWYHKWGVPNWKVMNLKKTLFFGKTVVKGMPVFTFTLTLLDIMFFLSASDFLHPHVEYFTSNVFKGGARRHLQKQIQAQMAELKKTDWNPLTCGTGRYSELNASKVTSQGLVYDHQIDSRCNYSLIKKVEMYDKLGRDWDTQTFKHAMETHQNWLQNVSHFAAVELATIKFYKSILGDLFLSQDPGNYQYAMELPDREFLDTQNLGEEEYEQQLQELLEFKDADEMAFPNFLKISEKPFFLNITHHKNLECKVESLNHYKGYSAEWTEKEKLEACSQANQFYFTFSKYFNKPTHKTKLTDDEKHSMSLQELLMHEEKDRRLKNFGLYDFVKYCSPITEKCELDEYWQLLSKSELMGHYAEFVVKASKIIEKRDLRDLFEVRELIEALDQRITTRNVFKNKPFNQQYCDTLEDGCKGIYNSTKGFLLSLEDKKSEYLNNKIKNINNEFSDIKIKLSSISDFKYNNLGDYLLGSMACGINPEKEISGFKKYLNYLDIFDWNKDDYTINAKKFKGSDLEGKENIADFPIIADGTKFVPPKVVKDTDYNFCENINGVTVLHDKKNMATEYITRTNQVVNNADLRQELFSYIRHNLKENLTKGEYSSNFMAWWDIYIKPQTDFVKDMLEKEYFSAIITDQYDAMTSQVYSKLNNSEYANGIINSKIQQLEYYFDLIDNVYDQSNYEVSNIKDYEKKTLDKLFLVQKEEQIYNLKINLMAFGIIPEAENGDAQRADEEVGDNGYEGFEDDRYYDTSDDDRRKNKAASRNNDNGYEGHESDEDYEDESFFGKLGRQVKSLISPSTNVDDLASDIYDVDDGGEVTHTLNEEQEAYVRIFKQGILDIKASTRETFATVVSEMGKEVKAIETKYLPKSEALFQEGEDKAAELKKANEERTTVKSKDKKKVVARIIPMTGKEKQIFLRELKEKSLAKIADYRDELNQLNEYFVSINIDTVSPEVDPTEETVNLTMENAGAYSSLRQIYDSARKEQLTKDVDDKSRVSGEKLNELAGHRWAVRNLLALFEDMDSLADDIEQDLEISMGGLSGFQDGQANNLSYQSQVISSGYYSPKVKLIAQKKYYQQYVIYQAINGIKMAIGDLKQYAHMTNIHEVIKKAKGLETKNCLTGFGKMEACTEEQ